MEPTPLWVLRGLQETMSLLIAPDRELPPTHLGAVVEPDRFACRGAIGGFPGLILEYGHRRQVRDDPRACRASPQNPGRAFSKIRERHQLGDDPAPNESPLPESLM